jgi:hypothetical protein
MSAHKAKENELSDYARNAAYVAWSKQFKTTRGAGSLAAQGYNPGAAWDESWQECRRHAEAMMEEEKQRPLTLICEWMIKNGYATGHGESVDDLLHQLDWQLEEQIKLAKERERKAFEAAWYADPSESKQSAADAYRAYQAEGSGKE